MTALTDLYDLQTVDTTLSYNEVNDILETTKRIMQSAKQVQGVFSMLKQIADSGKMDNAPTDLKAELVFYYQQITALKDAMTARAGFMELYDTRYPQTQ